MFSLVARCFCIWVINSVSICLSVFVIRDILVSIVSCNTLLRLGSSFSAIGNIDRAVRASRTNASYNAGFLRRAQRLVACVSSVSLYSLVDVWLERSLVRCPKR